MSLFRVYWWYAYYLEFIGDMYTVQSLLVEWERGKIPQCGYRISEKKSKRKNDAIEERGERKINLAFLVPQLLPILSLPVTKKKKLPMTKNGDCCPFFYPWLKKDCPWPKMDEREKVKVAMVLPK